MSGYSFCLLYWYKSTNTDAAVVKNGRYSFHVLCWYKSTNTDAAAAGDAVECQARAAEAGPGEVYDIGRGAGDLKALLQGS